MILDLARNIAILLALCMGYSIVSLRWDRRSLMGRILIGLIFGAAAVVGMKTPMPFAPGVIFDGRSILISIAGLFGGGLPAFLSAAIACTCRIQIGGAGVVVGCAVIAVSALIGVGYHHLRRRNTKDIPLASLYLFGVVVHIAMLLCMLGLPAEVRWQVLRTLTLPILIAYPLGTMLVGWLLREQDAHFESKEMLRQSEERYRMLTENAPDIIMRFDRDHRHQYVSPSIRQIVGMEPAELLGKTHREIGFPENLCTFWEKCIQTVFETGEPYETEFSFDGDKGPLLFNWRLSPEFDANMRVQSVLSISRDVTESRHSEENYRMLFERMLDSFALHEIICDETGKSVDYRFIAVNPAFERATGRSADDLIGKRVLEIYPDMEASWIERYGAVALGGPPQHFENYFHDLGKHFEVIAFSPLPGRFACIFRDITERKHAEEERKHLEAQVQHAQKLESLGVLAGGIAHDFNNLLMAILGNAELALDDLSPVSPARENLMEIEAASRRAAELCKQMLAYSGKGKFVIELISLSELVEEMAHMLEVSISKKALLKYDFTENLPTIEADATQMRQVVMNLITNASEAIGDRSGIISIRTGAMDCDRACLSESYLDDDLPEGVYIYVEVADTGCGMDEETRSRLFDPFFTTKFTGRGLGLSAVLGIVRGHRGAIKIYSEPNKGTTFKVLFPAADADLQAVASARSSKGETHKPLSGTVLLVDDEESVRALGKRMLEKAGLSVHTAVDGRDALTVFRAHLDAIDCVLLDMTMPHMDGEECYRELRRIRPGVRVVVSSGYNEQEIVHLFVGKNLVGFIQKPYRYAELVAKMREALEPDRSEKELAPAPQA